MDALLYANIWSWSKQEKVIKTENWLNIDAFYGQKNIAIQ